MRVVKKLVLAAALLALALFGVVFAFNNAGSMPVDIGFVRFESVPVPLAFAAVFAAGWLAGVGCAAPSLVRLGAERRRLRRRLESAQARLPTDAQ